MVEHQARDLEVRGSNPGPGPNFSIEFKFKKDDTKYIREFVLTERMQVYPQ